MNSSAVIYDVRVPPLVWFGCSSLVRQRQRQQQQRRRRRRQRQRQRYDNVNDNNTNTNTNNDNKQVPGAHVQLLVFTTMS